MKVSSSMISTSVAISAAISRPAASASLRVSATSVPRMKATSSSEKPSSDSSKKAWRGNGVIFDSRRSDGSGRVAHVRDIVERNRIPDLGEQPEQPGAGPVPLVEQGGILEQGLKHGSDIGVAGGLVSRQRPGVPPQQRQMFSNKL